MKRLLFASLLSAASVPLAFAGTYDSVNVGGINYTFNAADKTATVESRAYALNFPYTGDLVIPSTVDYQGTTYTVTAIGEYVVSDYETEVTSVTIPETVTSIANYAFDGTVLTEIVIPNSVKTIGAYAFEYSALQKITLGSGLTSIGANAFKNCTSLTEVTVLAETPATISDNTFPSAVKSKVTLKVPSGKAAAYQSAANWSGFKAYEELSAPAGQPVKVEYNGVWYQLDATTQEATVMTVYKLVDNGTLSTYYTGDLVIPETVPYGGKDYTVTTLGDECFYLCTVTSITLPSTLKKLGWESFYNIKTLPTLVIPDLVEVIEHGDFYASYLTSITLGAGVKTIENDAFVYSNLLKEMTVKATTPPALDATAIPATIKANTTLYVPKGTVAAYKAATNWDGFKAYMEISDGTEPVQVNHNGIWYELDPATQEATVMTVYKLVDNGTLSTYYTGEIAIPETVPYGGKDYTVTTLGDECFWQCTMTSLTLPSTLKKLGWESFYNIKTLTSIEIPDLVEVIEHGDFYAAWISSCTLGAGVKTIEYEAFTNANLLTELTVKATTPPALDATAIPATIKANTTLYVPKGTVAAYKAATNWNGFKTYKEIKDPIVNPVLIDGVYYTLTEAPYDGDENVFRCSVASPVSSGFANGDEYQGEIVVPESVTYDEQRYVVTAVDWYAFQDQTLLTGVTLPETVKTIGNSAFSNTSITKLTLPESVITLENYVFRKCDKLTELTVLNPVPPTVSSSTFNSTLTANCKLYVPRGCEQAYKKANYWKDFATIAPDPNSPIRPESITLSKSSFTGLVGSTVTLTATIMPEDATDKSVEWKSLDTSVAEVDVDGKVTLKAGGRANIEAISNGDRTLSAICSVVAVESQSAINGLEYRFELDEDNDLADAYVIRGSANYSGDIVIPATVQHGTTFKVVGIDQNAFALMGDVTSVTIPSSVKSVGRDAFRECTGLKRVNITSLEAWENIDFNNRNSNPVQFSGNLYVDNELVKSVKIPATMETVKPFVFHGLASMTSLEIAEGVKTIGENAFNGCTSITAVELPESIEEIGLSAFQGCSALASINLPSGLKSVETGILSRTAITEITVPEGVTYINNQAFQNCGDLKKVTLPSTLELIYMMVWDGCSHLESITCNSTKPVEFFQAQGFGDYALAFPSSIFPTCKVYVPEESIAAYREAAGWMNFAYISAIEPEGEKAEVDGLWYIFYTADKKASVIFHESYSGEITVPAKVTREGVEYDVTGVSSGAFDGLTAVTAINLPESVTTIGDRAFAGTSVDIFAVPQGVKTIPNEMMEGCSSLISLALPDHLESIGVKAFYGAEKLRFVFCNNYGTGTDNIPPVFTTYSGDPTDYGEAFSTEIWPDCMLVIPANMFMNYKKSIGWMNFRSWGYWHDYDIMPEKVVLTPSEIKGGENESFSTSPSVEPANATVLNYILTGVDPEIAAITVDKDAENNPVYKVELLKEGETTLTVYCGLQKAECTILCDNALGVNGIGADENVRWFDLNGFELKNPVKGQPMIRVRNGKSDKVIIF